MKSLEQEVVPDPSEDWHAHSAYRRHLVQACVYKSFLKILGDSVPDNLKASAERELERGISKGSQSFEVNEDEWPMNKPVEKIEAKAQVSGDAQYVGDIPIQKDELHGAFVYTDVAACELDVVDTSDALVNDCNNQPQEG